MKLPSPGFLLTAFLEVCRRFPGASLCAFLGTMACYMLVSDIGPSDSEEFFVRNWITCLLGLPFMVALAAFAESKSWSAERSWMVQGLGLPVLVGCWFWLNPKAENFDYQVLPQYLAMLLLGHLAVAVAPYLNKHSVRDFWEYNRQLFANLVVGLSFTFILYAGLALAILAVDNLFDLHIRERVYAKLFVLLAGIFNTCYFLYHFPQKYSAEEPGGAAYNLVFRNLCKYILIPIVILYFLILYAYGAKIGAQWSLPRGWVSSLVLGFSVAGIFTYLLNFYLPEEDDSVLAAKFRQWFWWVLLPLTLLLFIAIGKRIGDYGVTESRFLVAQLGVWLALNCLYFLFSKNDNLKFIPISLSLFVLSWSFGPLSAFAVAERSQKGILTDILKKSGRFENGKIKPGTGALSEEDRAQLSSSAYYLGKRDALLDLLPEPLDSSLLDSWALLNWLKIDSLENSQNATLSIGGQVYNEPLKIKGFDQAFRADLYPTNSRSYDRPGLFFELNEGGDSLKCWANNEDSLSLVEAYNLQPILDKWMEMKVKDEQYSYLNLSTEERTHDFVGKKGDLRWIVESAQVEIENSQARLGSANGWILLKEK